MDLIGIGYSSESDTILDGNNYYDATKFTNNFSYDSGIVWEHTFILIVQTLIIAYILMLRYTLLSGGYYDIGDLMKQCQECEANMWYQERQTKFQNATNPKLSMCCGNSKVQFPLLKKSPKVLQDLLFNTEKMSQKFSNNNTNV